MYEAPAERDNRARRGCVLALGLLVLVAWGQPAGATNCFTEVDPYYWTFDVPSMIHVNTPQQAAQVRRSVVDYLWGGRGYPGALPQVRPLACIGDPPPPRGPFPPGFPQQFPGLSLWLDAGDLSTVTREDGRVSRWDDKSGRNNHVSQDDPSRQPSYNRVGMAGSPALRFDGVDDFMDALDAGSLDIGNPTLFVVLQFAETTNAVGPVPLAKLPLDAAYLVKLSGGIPIARAALAEIQSTADSVPVGVDAEVWSAVLDGTTLRMFRDGWQSETAPKALGAANATSGPLRLGGGLAGTQSAFSGWIAEVILFDRPLSEADRAQIEEYLGWKYHIWRPWPRWISEIGGVDCVDRLEIPLDYGLRSVSYLLKPAAPTGPVSLFHQGHSDFALVTGGQRTIRRLLDRGHVVGTFWMPLLGENPKAATDVPGLGTVTFANHDEMAVLEDGRGSFIRFFLEPVVAGLNYIETVLAPPDINMIGISGGGWTTHLIAALDTRISLSFPVAGSLPLYLRGGPCNSVGTLGDSEQYWPPLYEDRATWLDLYALGGYGPGRKQVQILNQYDSCCFSGVGFQTYAPQVTSAVAGLGSGSFRVHLDSSAPLHQISQSALDTVIDPELAAQPLPYAPRTDLRVSQYISDDPVKLRGVLTYELRVDNDGASKADAAILSVAPPQGSTLVSATTSQGLCSEGVPVNCFLGTIAEGAAATITVVVMPEPGLATNTASVSYALPDVHPENDVSSLTTGVASPGDRDGDGVPDPADCAPSDWTVSAPPAEVTRLSIGSGGGDRDTVWWTPAGRTVGAAGRYDLLRGELATLPGETALAATCLATRITTPSLADPATPGPRIGFWYLAREANACGSGSLGTRSNGIERPAPACP